MSRSALIAVILSIAMMIGISSCGGGKSGEHAGHRADGLPDTLRIATLYSPTSYFVYRDESMGYHYEMIMRYAEDMKLPVKISVAPNMPELIRMVANGEADIAAADVPRTGEFKNEVDYCGPENVTSQVLVQKQSDHLLTDVTQLIGEKVTVGKDTKYYYRLQNLNDELGGGIEINTISRDTLIADDLVDMVSRGEIAYTVVDSDLAEINKTWDPSLDVSLHVSMDQLSSWGVAKGDSVLIKSVNNWMKGRDTENRNADLHKKYFELSKDPNAMFADEDATSLMIGGGKISRYDALFRKHGKNHGIDWRLLAAVGYNESKFRPTIVSWAGARGLMQLMPASARAYGLKGNIEDPDANIGTATKILMDLDKSLQGEVKDPTERRKFVLAAYNSGLAHVRDAIALAKKYGYDSTKWEGNVRNTLLLKSNPKYYNDAVVRHGYFRGQETVSFVDKVLNVYYLYRTKIKE